MKRRELLFGLSAACLPRAFAAPPEFSFHVLGLLKPQELMIGIDEPSLITHGAKQQELRHGQTFLASRANEPVSLIGINRKAAEFTIEVPNLIRRTYRGSLQVLTAGPALILLVRMDCETAVSSIVGAELPTDQTPVMALAAQAIVARTFLQAARPRHTGWDFCDTTHCQFLRSPAAPASTVSRVTRATEGLVLWSDGRLISARYSAACGGSTDEREEYGYRYRAVPCDVCRSEGYSRRGHGLGLCQMGAIGLAKQGWPHDRILAKYFPATYIGLERSRYIDSFNR